jgi:hypothetical protein
MAASDPLVPVGADQATLIYENESYYQLYRDTTGVSRWAFRLYVPESPEPLGSGTLTAAGVEMLAKSAKVIVSDGEILKGERSELGKRVEEGPEVHA